MVDIWENEAENYIKMSSVISTTDNDVAYHDIVFMRTKDKRYFKMEVVSCEHLSITDPRINDFPISATQVFPKVITCITYE